MSTSDTKGYVYVLSNPSFKWLKIGYSKNGGERRAIELSRESCLPTPFKLEFELFVEDAYAVEKAVHESFISKRISSSREFFDVTVEFASHGIQYFAGVVQPRQSSVPVMDLNIQHAYLLAHLVSDWRKTFGGGFVCFDKHQIADSVPIISDKPDTIYRYYSSLRSAGYIETRTTAGRFPEFRPTFSGTQWLRFIKFYELIGINDVEGGQS